MPGWPYEIAWKAYPEVFIFIALALVFFSKRIKLLNLQTERPSYNCQYPPNNVVLFWYIIIILSIYIYNVYKLYETAKICNHSKIFKLLFSFKTSYSYFFTINTANVSVWYLNQYLHYLQQQFILRACLHGGVGTKVGEVLTHLWSKNSQHLHAILLGWTFSRLLSRNLLISVLQVLSKECIHNYMDRLLPHLPRVPHLHVNRPVTAFINYLLAKSIAITLDSKATITLTLSWSTRDQYFTSTGTSTLLLQRVSHNFWPLDFKVR